MTAAEGGRGGGLPGTGRATGQTFSQEPGLPPGLPPVLHRVSLAALTWLHRHLPDFRLPAQAAGPGVDRDVTLKPLGELAQLSLSTLRASPPGSEQHELARESLDFAWRETARGDLFLSLVRGEPHATYPMEIYGVFAEAGLRHAEFEEYARFTARTRAWWSSEQEPTRTLSLLNTLRRLGIPADGSPPGTGTESAAVPDGSDGAEGAAEYAEAMRRTWLGGLAEPWAFERRSGYALTHYVFHVTNWGAAPARLPADVCDYLALWLPSWLDGCVECAHWDLTGELLAVAASLPAPYERAVPVVAAWSAFAEAQSAAGAVAEDGPPPSEESPGAFLGCYHSTLVGAFAAVLAARSGADASPAPAPSPYEAAPAARRSGAAGAAEAPLTASASASASATATPPPPETRPVTAPATTHGGARP